MSSSSLPLIETFFRRYAALGWSVIPISPRTKFPSVAWKLYQTKRADSKQLHSWAVHERMANIGVICGSISGIFVLDVDTNGPRMRQLRVGGVNLKSGEEIPAQPERYKAALAFQEELVASLPVTATARTANGRHFYFRIPDGTKIPTKTNFRDGLDCCAEGHFAMLPPSLHPNGTTTYLWEPDRNPEDGIADPPAALLDLIAQSRGEIEGHAIGGGVHWRSTLAGVAQGARNESAASFIGKLLSTAPEPAWPIAWEVADAWNLRNAPPMEAKELRGVFDSIAAREVEKRAAGGNDVTIYTAADLEDQEFKEPGFAVSRLIVDGLTMLYGKPRVGKSILLVQILNAVSRGIAPWPSTAESIAAYGGFSTTRGDVLYLALEDSVARVMRRLRAASNGAGRIPTNLQFVTDWPALYDGGVVKIESWIDEHPDARLVVVDTLTAFLGPHIAKGSAFTSEYRLLRPLWELARRRALPILVIHHSRKAMANDAVDNVAGTLGLTASTDTAIEMVRPQGSRVATLTINSRDVESFVMAVEIEEHGTRWRAVPLPSKKRTSTRRETNDAEVPSDKHRES